MSDSAFATAAAREFVKRHPLYVVNAHNSKLMTKAILELVDNEGADPASVFTYDQAFRNCLQDLELKEPEPKKSVEEMDGSELSKLSDPQKDRLPTHLFRKLADYELQQRSRKPALPEEIAMFKPLFDEQDVAFSRDSLQIVRDWLDSRELGYTEGNLRLAIITCEDQLEPSEQVLDSMSADEYRKSVVEPAFRQRRAAQPKHESRVPLGVKYTEWLHNS